VLFEGIPGVSFELVGVGAGGLQLPQQGRGLPAEGLLHLGELVEVLAVEELVEPVGLGFDAALAPGLLQQGPETSARETGRR
jgi:hypothetical protein